MELLQRWNRISLVKRIIAGLLLGALLGLLCPGAAAIGILGSLFVGALKALAHRCGELSVGDRLRLNGRLQSRGYVKTLEDGRVEERTAFEVSVMSMDLGETDT